MVPRFPRIDSHAITLSNGSEATVQTFQRSIFFCCSNRVNQRRDGGCLCRWARTIGLWSFYYSRKLNWGVGCLRVLHEERPRSLPGGVQGARDHQQQLASGTSGEGARTEAGCVCQRLQDTSRRDRELREGTSSHGWRGSVFLFIACDNQSQLQVSNEY